MSEDQSTELASTFFTVHSSAFGLLDRRIGVRVNTVDPDLIELTVGATHITTSRANWTRIFTAFANTLRDEVVEISLPGHTVTVNGERTAVGS